jgi:hypothetical protein
LEIMKKLTIAMGTSAVVLLGALAPVSAAFAADQTLSGVVTVDGIAPAPTEVGWFDPTTGASGETTSAADGSYSLTVADGHSYVLYAGVDHTQKGNWTAIDLANYVPVFQGAAAADYLYQGLALYPAPTGPLTGQNIDLDKPGAVTGRVAALANRTVKIVSLAGNTIAKDKADKNGKYKITGLIPGRYRIAASATKTYEDYSSTVKTVTAGKTLIVKSKLTKAASISGVITSSSGKPIKGIPVQAFGGASLANGIIGDTTDSRGRYSIRGLAKGTYIVAVNYSLGIDSDSSFSIGSDNAYVPKVVARVKVSTSEKQKTNVKLATGGTINANVRVKKGTKSVSAYLVDPKGDSATSEATRVSKGVAKVKLSGLKTGTYTLIVTDSAHKYYAKKKVKVTRGDVTTTGALSLSKKTRTLAGTFTGADTASIVYVPNTFTQVLVTTATGGAYSIPGVIPGYSGSIIVSAEKHSVSEVTVPAKTTALDLTAGAAYGAITGTVLVDGHPKAAGSGAIESDGALFDGLELGQYTIANGVITGDSEAGTGILAINERAGQNEFVTKAPFYVSVPAATPAVTVTSGATTDVGTIALQINR